jgi:hypothetical protein
VAPGRSEYDAGNFEEVEVTMQALEASRAADLGSLVGEHKQGDTSLWLFRRGLFVEHRRAKFAGGFDDIRGVYLDDATRGGSALRLKLPGRLWVRLKGGDEQADATLHRLLRMATPALLRRCVAEYDSGERVDFGAVRLSRDFVAVRRLVGWKRLPLARLSGWAVRGGWLFLDEGTGRPEPFAEVRVRRIANLEVLIALLRKGRAEADLSQPANALRHAARERGWFARPSGALTRRPRTLGRAMGRWALYAAAIAAGGYLGMHYDVPALALRGVDAVRSLYDGLI